MTMDLTSAGRRIAAVGLAAATATGAAFMATPHAQAATTSSLSCAKVAIDSTSTRFRCSVSGTTNQTSVTLPMTVSQGVTVPYGTYPMASGAGTMTLSAGKVTFTFSKAYTSTHEAPYTYTGGFTFFVDNKHVKGPFSVSVDGKTFVTTGPGGYCGNACADDFPTGAYKGAWDDGDGFAHFNLILGHDRVVVGQKVTFIDQAGAGQSNCSGQVEQELADGTWHRVAGVTGAGTNRLSATYTPTATGALRLIGECAVDGLHSTYTDTGSIAGQAVNASTSVTKVYADGHGVNKPSVPMVTETYQVDVAQITGSNATVNRYLAADNDRRLTYGELNSMWLNKAYRRHFSEKHQFVTIHVPANATVAQRIAAINAQTTIGDVTTTTLAGPSKLASGTFVYAWKLDTAHGARATDKLAWGPKHNLAQAFFARG